MSFFKFCIVSFFFVLSLDSAFVNAQVSDSTHTLDEVYVVAPVKETRPLRNRSVASSSFGLTQMEQEKVSTAKDLSVSTPNFYVPDYGSNITSSIYIRGFGARIDQPVMGLNVDNIPYLNKNNFDFDFFDIQRVDVLRGPQGTLYGRNTMGGVMNVFTISPYCYKGVKASVDYSTGNTVKARASVYDGMKNGKLFYSLAAYYGHTDGFFENSYDGEMCDPSDNGGARVRIVWRPSVSLTLDNVVSFGHLSQGGYAYAEYDRTSDARLPISYNDECGYDRTSLMEGLRLQYRGPMVDISSVTSYQLLDDKMTLDQDFQPKPIFTLQQMQTEHAITQDLVVKPRNGNRVWNWQFGLWGFYKHNDMEAPVLFKRAGIEELILNNANAGMQKVFPSEYIDIEEQQFLISSTFDIPTYGTAAYHQSEFRLGKWIVTAGLRLDYEHASMDYRNAADVHYLFSLLMDDYRLLESRMDGKEEKSFVEFLPKISVQYTLDAGNNIYAYVAKGYKAGGFNTQIFSDILQSRMMNGMMSALGVYMDGVGETTYNSAKATSYDPEYSWNYEVGGHFSSFDSRLLSDLSFFFIDCRDQQLTVFPQGKNTGRMMTNAGKTRSFGAEASLTYRFGDLTLTGAYGYANAKFVDYDDGNNDYGGKYVPYAPMNTAAFSAQYVFRLKGFVDKILLSCNWKGVGDIYWNESNDLRQNFYSMIGSIVSLSHKNWELGFWGKNLTDADYNTFYFLSMGNSFVQQGKPRQLGVSLKYDGLFSR